MAGLGVIFFIGLYFFIAYKIVKATNTKHTKWLAIVILILIPMTDEVVGRIYLQHLCTTEGGLKVYRVAQGVDGYMNDGSEDFLAVEKYGYKFSESRPLNGRVSRYSKVNEQIVKEADVLPKSNYRVRYLTTGQKDVYMQQALVVETFPGGEVLATDTQIGFSGGWVERFVAKFGSGSRVWCKSKDVNERHRELIVSSLKN